MSGEWNITFGWASFAVGVLSALIWQDVISAWWALSFPLLIVSTPWDQTRKYEWRRGAGWRRVQ